MELYAKRGGGRGGGGGQPKEREREEEGCCPGVCAAVKRGEGEGGTWRKNGMGKKEERNGRRQERREGKGEISDASWLQLGNGGEILREKSIMDLFSLLSLRRKEECVGVNKRRFRFREILDLRSSSRPSSSSFALWNH